jgi:hypothetical protein
MNPPEMTTFMGSVVQLLSVAKLMFLEARSMAPAEQTAGLPAVFFEGLW